MIRKLIFTIFLIPAFAMPGWGATVYIKDVSGTVYYESGASSCDDVTADDTAGDLQDAITASGASGTCYVCSNLTGAQIDADSQADFTADNQSLIGIGTVVLDGDGNPSQVLYLDNRDGITISNISITGATSEGIHARNGNDLTIDGCTAYSNGHVGIYVYARDQDLTGVQITNNTVYNNGGADTSADHQIFLQAIVNAGSWTIISPIITGNTVYGSTDTGYDGIKLKGSYTDPNTGSITGATISDNEVYGLEYGGISLEGNVDNSTVSENNVHDLEWYGIGTQGHAGADVSSGNIIQKNTITDVAIRASDGAGIIFDNLSGTGNKARYNWIENAAEAGVKIRSSSQEVTYNIIIGTGENGIEYQDALTGTCPETLNNTLYGSFSNAGLLASDGTCAGGAGNIKNNIIMDSNSSPTGILIHSGSSATEDYNLVYGFTNNCDDETPGGGSCGNNDINSDPLFVNSGSDDFSLQSGSPCRNVGTNLGSSYDDGLDPSSTWPDSVSTLDQDSYGDWERGAYVFDVERKIFHRAPGFSGGIF